MQSIKKKLDELMQAEIDGNNAVGTGLYVFKDNELIYQGFFGSDTPGSDKKLDENSIFRMFSMTKPVTSLACMMAMEQGLFKPESKISEFLPGFKNAKVIVKKDNGEYETVPAEREITVEDCLTMTAGLEYPNDQTEAGMLLGEGLFWTLEGGYPEKKMGTVELMNKTGEFPLLYQPGEHWNYSLCADVIAAVIEVSSGMRYGDYLKKYIFEPLGMKDTGFYVPAEKLDRLVTMHDKQGDAWVKWEGTFLGMEKKNYGNPELQVRPEFESGGAGLVSTPVDYIKFLSVLANHGVYVESFGKNDASENTAKAPMRLISEESWKYMTAPRLNEDQLSTANWYSLQGYNYGCLMRVLADPEKAETPMIPCGEFGWDGWAGTYFSVDPVNNIVLLYFINVTNGNREWQMKALKRVIYDNL